MVFVGGFWVVVDATGDDQPASSSAMSPASTSRGSSVAAEGSGAAWLALAVGTTALPDALAERNGPTADPTPLLKVTGSSTYPPRFVTQTVRKATVMKAKHDAMR